MRPGAQGIASPSLLSLANIQSRPEAAKHYTGKAEFVGKNLETLQKTIERKQDNLQSVIQVLQMKLQQAQQPQQPAK